MLPSRSAVLMAGEVLAHAVLLVSGMPEGEVPTPLGSVLRSGESHWVRFESEGVFPELIEFARAQLVDQQGDLEAWRLTYDARVKKGEETVDAVILEIWSPSMESPASFAQAYRREHSGDFRRLGEPALMGPETPGNETSRSETLSILREGMRNHPEAWKRWDAWLAPD